MFKLLILTIFFRLAKLYLIAKSRDQFSGYELKCHANCHELNVM